MVPGGEGTTRPVTNVRRAYRATVCSSTRTVPRPQLITDAHAHSASHGYNTIRHTCAGNRYDDLRTVRQSVYPHRPRNTRSSTADSRRRRRAGNSRCSRVTRHAIDGCRNRE
jgi:hypothetical protein